MHRGQDLEHTRRFCTAEAGATVVEYVLMLALIAIVCLTALTQIGKSTNCFSASVTRCEFFHRSQTERSTSRKERSVDRVQAVPIMIVLLAALITTVTDLWKFKIYNVLTVPLLISGLVYHCIVGGLPGLGASLLGAVFGFGMFLFFYVMGGMGAGDVKLMAAIGAWLGLPLTFHVFIASSLAAGLYSVILLVVEPAAWSRPGPIADPLAADHGHRPAPGHRGANRGCGAAARPPPTRRAVRRDGDGRHRGAAFSWYGFHPYH